MRFILWPFPRPLVGIREVACTCYGKIIAVLTLSSRTQQKESHVVLLSLCWDGDAESNYTLRGLNNAENELFVSCHFLSRQCVAPRAASIRSEKVTAAWNDIWNPSSDSARSENNASRRYRNLKETLMEIKKKDKAPVWALVMPVSGKLPAASEHFFVCIKSFFFFPPLPLSLQSITSPWWGSWATAMSSNSPVVQRGKQPQSFLPWRHIWDANGLFMTLQFRPLPVGPVLCIVQCQRGRRWTAEQGAAEEPVVV